MSERFIIPLEGSNVVKQGESLVESRERVEPPVGVDQRERRVGMSQNERLLYERRNGLGQTLARGMGRTELEPQWEANRYSGQSELKWRAPQPEQSAAPQSPLEQAHAQLSELENTVGMLMQNQFGGAVAQGDQGAVGAPDVTQYDMWDEESVAEYNRANNAYIAQESARRVNEALAPHRAAMRMAQHEQDFNALAAEHGDDPNFRNVMLAALELMKDDEGLSMPEAYKQANNPKNAKLGRRGNAHLPEDLRAFRTDANGKRQRNLQTGLGRIMAHNQMSGRAAPIKRGRR